MNETRVEENKKPKDVIIQEQFKSTKRWNGLIEEFCTNMPLKKHWRNFRTYSDCFTASEAIEWLYKHLKTSPSFSHLSITRQNAIKVLQIYLKQKIIEDVRGNATSNESTNNKEFQDDDRVYRFNPTSQHYVDRSTSLNLQLGSLESTTSTSKGSNLKEDLENKFNKNYESLSDLMRDKSVEPSSRTNVLSEKQLNTQRTKSSNERDETHTNKTVASKHSNKYGIKFNTTSVSVLELEIWSKITRKMLESVLKKAVLNNNMYKYPKYPTNDYNQLDMNVKFNYVNRISPTKSSTLKRSSDIKLSLSKLLDKKSNDLLVNVSGQFIRHNCVHINKHGVVTNIEDDLPGWVAKAMTTLLMWEEETETKDEHFPRFQDVFNEICSCFNDLTEPLLTNELSHLFIAILRLLMKPKLQMTYVNKTLERNCKDYEEQVNEEKSIEPTMQNSAIKLNKLIEVLKDHLNYLDDEDELQSEQPHLMEQNELMNKCSSNRLLIDSILNDQDIFEQIESKLIENAKLPSLELDKNQGDEQADLIDEFEQQLLLQNLLFESVTRLENCCGDCLQTYNNICDLLCAKEDEQAIDEHFPTYSSSETNENHELVLKKNKNLEARTMHVEQLLFNPMNEDESDMGPTERKLRRNNSFRAAIGDIEKQDDQFEPKSDVKLNTFKSHLGLQSARENENKLSDEFQFKLPEQPLPHATTFTKSKSMHFNSFRNKKSKRKSSSFQVPNDPRTNSTHKLANSKLAHSTHMSISSSDLTNLMLLNKILPSLSLTSLNHQPNELINYKNMNNFSSLKNLSTNVPLISDLTTPNCSTKINDNNNSNNLSNQERESRTNANISLKVKIESILKLNTEIDSDIFWYIISAFRLCALMLPPQNKRKLHLLLRFLNKLKYSKYTPKYLLTEKHMSGENRAADDSVTNTNAQNAMDDINFIDASSTTFISNNSLYFTPSTMAATLNEPLMNETKALGSSSRSNKAQLTHANSVNSSLSSENKSIEIEALIIHSFLNSIINVNGNNQKAGSETTWNSAGVDNDDEQHHLNEENENYAIKLVQILINNYSEIMRIPSDLLNSISKKLTEMNENNKKQASENEAHGTVSSSGLSNTKNSTTNSSLASGNLKTMSKEQLTKMLNNILTDVNLDEQEKLARLKKFKEAYPHIYEEKYSTIKKALNILGLNETIANLNLNSTKAKLDECNASEKQLSNNGKLFLSEATKKSVSSFNKSILNNTTIFVNSQFGKNSMTSMLQATNLPKFFLNRKRKQSFTINNKN